MRLSPENMTRRPHCRRYGSTTLEPMLSDYVHRLRVFAVVLAILLPLKTIAAAVIPITGVPGHHHASESPHADDRHDAAGQATAPLAGTDGDRHADKTAPPATPQCAAHATQLPGTEGAHEHGCPHLGMALICMAVMSIAATDASPCAASPVDTPPASVVLDVPLPPPTA